VSVPIHTLQISNNRRNDSLILDLMSAATSTDGTGFGLVQQSLDLSPPPESVLYDPQAYGRDGQEARAGTFANRVISFNLTLKGTSQDDVHALLGQLGQIARAARQYSYFGRGARPRLKWRSALASRAFYARIKNMQLTVPKGYGGVEIASNFIQNVGVKLTCDPDLEEYTRPIFVANAWSTSTNLNRQDGRATEGVDLKSGNYLTANWNRAVTTTNDWQTGITTAGGAVIVWFRYEWNNPSDAVARCLFTTDLDGGFAAPTGAQI